MILMQLRVYDVKRFSIIVILFAAIAASGISTIPSAMAMLSPSLSATPLPVIQGGITILKITGAGDNTPPHLLGMIRVFDPNLVVSGGAGSTFGTGACTPRGATGAGSAWDLETSNGGLVVYKLAAATDTLEVTFGGGSSGIFPVVTLTDISGSSTVTAGTPGYKWTEVAAINANGLPDNTLVDTTASPYTFYTCGFDSVAGADPISGTFQYNADIPFTTKKPVGGTILPIDTTALLIAGASVNAIWLLPVLAGLAVGVFTLLRFQVVRKQN